MSILSVSNLTFSYEGSGENVFEGLSFQLDTIWRTGLTARNGRGKTTLLHILEGTLRGTGTVEAPAACTYFPPPVAHPERDTLDVLTEAAPEAEEWELMRELGLLEVEWEVLYRPFSTLSGGEQVKALLAALFCRRHDFLLLDEPTNHLDARGRESVGAYLASKKGFLLVSHDRAFLDQCVDHILALNKTGAQVRRGDFSGWWAEKCAHDRGKMARNEALRREIGRLEAGAERARRWADKTEAGKYGTRNSGLRPDRGYVGHQAAKLMGRSRAIEERRQRAAEEKATLLRDVEKAEELAIHPLLFPRERLMECREVGIAYDGCPVFAPVTFALRRGQRLAVTGANGCGKTSLLRLLAGEAVPCTGSLERSGGLVISRVSQHTDEVRGCARDYARAQGVDETLFFTLLRKLDFPRERFDRDMADYSAGEKKKVLIARSLCQQAHLYIWDEPLNYIDVYARMQIEELLVRFAPTMVLVEHDRAFLEKVATGELKLSPPEA